MKCKWHWNQHHTRSQTAICIFYNILLLLLRILYQASISSRSGSIKKTNEKPTIERDHLWCNKMNSPQQEQKQKREIGIAKIIRVHLYLYSSSAHSVLCVILETGLRCYPLWFCRTWRKGEIYSLVPGWYALRLHVRVSCIFLHFERLRRECVARVELSSTVCSRRKREMGAAAFDQMHFKGVPP